MKFDKFNLASQRLNLSISVFLSRFSNEKRTTGIPIGSPVDELDLSWIPPTVFSNEKRTREVPYWRVGLHSSAPGGSGPNGNRITLVFLFLFMDSMKNGLIIALLDSDSEFRFRILY